MAIVKTLIVKGVARFLTDAYMSTIRSGIWNGSTIQVGYGGTGVTSAKGDLYTPVFLSSSGIAPCTVAIPHNTKDFKINGTTYSIYTTFTGTAPTIFAPTTLAGTGGYILATNAAKTGLEWVAANGHTHSLYVLLDSGTNEQVIKSSISSLGDGVISLWRATSGGYPMIGFANGTTKTHLGKLGFGAEANKPIFRNTSNTDYLLAHAGNIVNNNITVALNTEKTIATIAGVAIKLKVTGTNNVTTSAVVASSATGTTLITAAQANPYYNLLEGGSVTRSIRFVAGNGITISAAADGQITITNSKPDVNHNTDHRKAFYGTCDTAAATAAKVVTISDTTGWELRAGTVIGVKFTNANTASNVTLAVNSEAAKSIFYNNAAYTGASADICGNAGRLTYYMYDGTYWVYIGNSYIINTSYSTMSLDEITTGTATSLRVMTAKIINDWLHTKPHTVSGTWTHSTSSFATGLIIERSGSANAASIQFKNSNGSLGYIGMTSTANGGLLRWKSDTSASYLIADASNIVNNNISVAWNTETTIATIAGVPIKIKIPANPNTNTWRNIYTGGTSRVGTGTDTKAMNFAVAGNLSVSYLAAGTGSGQSGSADYFTVKITANANAVGVAGYVAAPTKAANPNQVWMTNADGAPAWRTINLSTAAISASVTKTLNVDSWTDVSGFNGTGTYAIQISCGDLYASGILSGSGGSDTVIDEVPLHVTNKGANTWRPYVRVNGGLLQMTTNEASPGTERTYTIKILKLI